MSLSYTPCLRAAINKMYYYLLLLKGKNFGTTQLLACPKISYKNDLLRFSALVDVPEGSTREVKRSLKKKMGREKRDNSYIDTEIVLYSQTRNYYCFVLCAEHEIIN